MMMMAVVVVVVVMVMMMMMMMFFSSVSGHRYYCLFTNTLLEKEQNGILPLCNYIMSYLQPKAESFAVMMMTS